MNINIIIIYLQTAIIFTITATINTKTTTIIVNIFAILSLLSLFLLLFLSLLLQLLPSLPWPLSRSQLPSRREGKRRHTGESLSRRRETQWRRGAPVAPHVGRVASLRRTGPRETRAGLWEDLCGQMSLPPGDER